MSLNNISFKKLKFKTLPGKITDQSEVDLLVQKGNLLHLLLLLLLFVYCVIFAVINYTLGHTTETYLTVVPLPFVILSYILYTKGYSVLSKFINLIQITNVVGLLSMASTPVTGILAFYIPILLGTQLTFHGKERKYAHILTAYGLIALVFFLTTDITIGEQPLLRINNPKDFNKLHTEWFFNFLGATIATVFEIIFILSVSNKIQQDLFDKTAQVNKKNAELNSALEENIENSKLISQQLELIKKSEQEQAKLSLIATKTNTGVIITDAFGRVEWVNDAFTKISGYRLEEATGKKPKEFLQAKDLNHPAQKVLHDKLSKKEFVEVVIPNIKKNGDVFINQLEVNPVFDDEGTLINFISLQRDITSEMELQNSLNQKNEELLKANSELDKFVYSVSHDLRSPLLSVKGLLSLVVAMPELDAKVMEYIVMAQKSVGRLDETIGEILEYSRNSRLNLTFESFNVQEMIEQIFDAHKFIVEEGFEFKLDITGDVNLYSDRARMNTLLRNLIGNAVKYRRREEENQFVLFSLKRSEGYIIMEVADNGEGIPDYVKPKIFEMFYRGSTTGTGTGLGLYICSQIAEKLNGFIKAESEHGKGAIFIVEIPEQPVSS
ncbi:MAG: PAS domain S-box protein [Ferruginibacter sp.]|nr:PAS domain S-box protein [Ferruginibacter sp.]